MGGKMKFYSIMQVFIFVEKGGHTSNQNAALPAAVSTYVLCLFE